MKGYIYILTHKRMPGLVKIGFTTTTVEQRVSDINSATGVPGDFEVFHHVEVGDAQKVESEIHRKLRKFRYVTDKEFYDLHPAVAREYVDRIIEGQEFDIQFDPSSMVSVGDSKRLGNLIRSHRKNRNISQRELSSKAGTGLRFIIDIEHGKATARIGKILDVLSALDLCLAIDTPFQGAQRVVLSGSGITEG